MLSVALQATVILPIEFKELVTTSPVIVHGRVTDTRAVLLDGRQTVETFVTVDVEEYLKGNLGEHVTFRVPGGQIGRYKTIFVGAPEFNQGDEVVLFLKAPTGGVPFIVGLNQGAYRVMPDARTGQRVVTTPILMGRGDGQPETVVRGDVTRRPLAIDAFREAVRQVLARGVRQ